MLAVTAGAVLLSEPSYGAATTVQDLGSDCWNLRSSNGSVEVSATVPGSVQLNLMRHGVIGDPFAGYNDVLTQWVALDNWTLSFKFSTATDVYGRGAVLLQCEGLDTIAK